MRNPWICAALVFLPIASAAQTVVQPLVEVPDKKGKLLADGSIRFEVHVTCVPFGDTGENNVTVTQDDQRLSAQRGIGTLDCDGKRHKYRIVAKPVEGSFHEGTAQVSAFVSQIDTSTSEARQGQATAAIEVK